MINKGEYKITYNFNKDNNGYDFENILSKLFRKYLINYDTK